MIPVCRTEDLPEGGAVRIEIDAATPAIAVFRSEGALYALDDRCSHQDASLSEGWVEGCQVECPLHAALFDLRTGMPSCLPARRPVRTHEVTEAYGMIHVRPAAREPAAREDAYA
ncbi:bifunctional 3-phenylpropionate/cinnamic acid dioxygenase ferredoxin subunit [Streptomyces chrestomyceticus JCM 4735]|uniref:Bifunctional 3-phenylpropionate/cinnamic acid dioxygenase ferredoxin subunit n=1 Tax=Streptomyces chrestomyceticus JCM 4735 TaxID=1306181 RepID=A0A7U9L1M7_9ACTN|nr:bifunctional 3-phenylpropionate/cinnamic acid dioxygenase ferredoxin subunit [Streptomyces chrestomyceticus]GCD39390.1 bifunctional 3-phenylpropionate/cinnamic acid dioxygenase ferredoxin subunit [Streptomyces chrestomyceticus JCM 4735]